MAATLDWCAFKASPERGCAAKAGGRGGLCSSVRHSARRLARCVVGLVEDMAGTRRVLRHWLPWAQWGVEEGNEKGGGVWENRGAPSTRQQEAEEELSPEQLAVIRKHNERDLRLYAYARQRFARQLEAMRKT